MSLNAMSLIRHAFKIRKLWTVLRTAVALAVTADIPVLHKLPLLCRPSPIPL